MLNRSVWRSTIMLPALALLLSGCFGEPSSSNMLEALNSSQQYQQVLSLLSMDMRGRVSDVTLNDLKSRGVVEKSSCAAAQGTPGYVCDFRWGTRQPDGSIQYSTPMKARFFKAGGEWKIEL